MKDEYMKYKYLILGNGWLGNMLKDYLDDDAQLWASHIWHTDVLDLSKYDVVINTIAKTKIDWCEKNKRITMDSNVSIAVNLAEQCAIQKKKYVFISSSCIFSSKDGTDWKMENSIPNPQCFYALTKWIAEELIMEADPNSLIVRIRLPISEKSHPRNTLDKLDTYPLINDTQESVTVIEDFIPMLYFLIKKEKMGIYHLINEGTISPHEIAELMGHPHEVVTKAEQDKRLASEDKAKRVTAYISTNYPKYLLPSIHSRIEEVVEKWKQSKNKKLS